MRLLRAHVDRGHDTGDGPLRIVVASEGVKADGLDLRMDRVRLDRWRSNPVVLYGHRASGRDNLPIGRAEDIAVDGPRLTADVTFDTDDPFAAEVDRKYRNRYLNAFSVGFDVGAVDRFGVPDWWEPLEVSAVPVPLDPDALVEDGRDQLVAIARAFAGLERGDSGVIAALRDLVDDQPCPRCHTRDDPPDDLDDPPAASDASLDLARRRLRLAGI